MIQSQTFLQALVEMVCGCVGNDFSDNYDEARFGPLPKASRRLPTPKELVKHWLKRRGYGPLRESGNAVQSAINLVAPCLPRLEKLYSSLQDAESKTLLVQLMAFRSLGHRKVKLPLNTPDYWQALKEFQSLASNKDEVEPGFLGWKLQRTDLHPVGIPVALYTAPGGAYAIFKLEPYRCRCLPAPVAAEPGDVAIDGGGCWGDTALYFANKVGSAGRVFTFEFLPSNLHVLRRNLDLNPDLNSRVEVVERALWDRSDVALSLQSDGPGTRVSASPISHNSESVLTLSIDDLAANKNLTKLDFIKMDIEGAELAALRGAERVLRRFKPKLAISVYHRLNDFFDIPDYLKSLGVGYQFYLRHFTIHAEETVLFARVP